MRCGEIQIERNTFHEKRTFSIEITRTGPEQRSPNTEQAFTEQPNHEQRTEHEHEHEQRMRT